MFTGMSAAAGAGDALAPGATSGMPSMTVTNSCSRTAGSMPDLPSSARNRAQGTYSDLIRPIFHDLLRPPFRVADACGDERGRDPSWLAVLTSKWGRHWWPGAGGRRRYVG